MLTARICKRKLNESAILVEMKFAQSLCKTCFIVDRDSYFDI